MRSPLFSVLAVATASVAAVPAAGDFLDFSVNGTDDFDGVTVTIDGDLDGVVETLSNPNLISLFDGDNVVDRISASGGSDQWNITITDPGVLNTKYLILRDPDGGNPANTDEDWLIETFEGSGVAPSGIVYLGGADDDDDEVLSFARYANTTFNPVTGLFAAGDNVRDDYFVLDITAVTGTFSLDPVTGGTQFGIFVGQPIPEPSTLGLLGLGGACMLSRRSRSKQG